jgi:choline dehydrogenase-like flavoprotein
LEATDEGVTLAGGRLVDFHKALPQKEARRSIRQLLDAVAALSFAWYVRTPAALSKRQRAELVDRLFDPEERWPPTVVDLLAKIGGPKVPSSRDLARFLKEVCNLAFYSSPSADRITGFTPLWKQERVLQIAPEEADSHVWTRKDRTRLDHAAIRVRHAVGTDIDDSRLFAYDGRPKVAVIGSGAGGAVAASRLAPYFDVAVFEAGPRLQPMDYPTDGLAAMALLYDHGVLYPSDNRDLRVLAGRVVGGSSAVNEGVSIRPRKRTLDSWLRGGAGFDRAALSAAIDAVEVRQRFTEYARDLLTTPSLRFAEGMEEAGELMVDLLKADIATHASMHDLSPHGRDGIRGSRCLACGYCNHGCRFGHHLSVDRTFLRDAEAAGARVHPNLPVRSLESTRGPDGRVRVTGLRIRGRPKVVKVDHVVLAAGAIGTPALMLRSMRRRSALASIPCADQVGRGLGFNYGTAVVARWDDDLPRPGAAGLQVGFIATRPGDESFLIENGWITPTIFSTLAPGIGRVHREWMTQWNRLGFAVNTIGSPPSGRIDRRGAVDFSVDQGQMEIVWQSLADTVDAYLFSGATRVGLSGVRSAGSRDVFDPSWRGQPHKIKKRLEETAPTPEHLGFSSGHPQGGMALAKDPSRGVVGSDFRVHGTVNLFVSDASLFPDTITINPQWLVMALGWTAGDAARSVIAAEKG